MIEVSRSGPAISEAILKGLRWTILFFTLVFLLPGCTLVDAPRTGDDSGEASPADIMIQIEGDTFSPEDEYFWIRLSVANHSPDTVSLEICFPPKPLFRLEKMQADGNWSLAYNLFCPSFEYEPVQIAPDDRYQGIVPVPAHARAPAGLLFSPISGTYRLRLHLDKESDTGGMVVTSPSFVLQDSENE